MLYIATDPNVLYEPVTKTISHDHTVCSYAKCVSLQVYSSVPTRHLGKNHSLVIFQIFHISNRNMEARMLLKRDSPKRKLKGHQRSWDLPSLSHCGEQILQHWLANSTQNWRWCEGEQQLLSVQIDPQSIWHVLPQWQRLDQLNQQV